MKQKFSLKILLLLSSIIVVYIGFSSKYYINKSVLKHQNISYKDENKYKMYYRLEHYENYNDFKKYNLKLKLFNSCNNAKQNNYNVVEKNEIDLREYSKSYFKLILDDDDHDNYKNYSQENNKISLRINKKNSISYRFSFYYQFREQLDTLNSIIDLEELEFGVFHNFDDYELFLTNVTKSNLKYIQFVCVDNLSVDYLKSKSIYYYCLERLNSIITSLNDMIYIKIQKNFVFLRSYKMLNTSFIKDLRNKKSKKIYIYSELCLENDHFKKLKNSLYICKDIKYMNFKNNLIIFLPYFYDVKIMNNNDLEEDLNLYIDGNSYKGALNIFERIDILIGGKEISDCMEYIYGNTFESITKINIIKSTDIILSTSKKISQDKNYNIYFYEYDNVLDDSYTFISFYNNMFFYYKEECIYIVIYNFSNSYNSLENSDINYLDINYLLDGINCTKKLFFHFNDYAINENLNLFNRLYFNDKDISTYVKEKFIKENFINLNFNYFTILASSSIKIYYINFLLDNLNDFILKEEEEKKTKFIINHFPEKLSVLSVYSFNYNGYNDYYKCYYSEFIFYINGEDTVIKEGIFYFNDLKTISFSTSSEYIKSYKQIFYQLNKKRNTLMYKVKKGTTYQDFLENDNYIYFLLDITLNDLRFKIVK